ATSGRPGTRTATRIAPARSWPRPRATTAAWTSRSARTRGTSSSPTHSWWASPMAKGKRMGSSTVITRNGVNGALNIQRSHLWTTLDRDTGGFAAVDHGFVSWTFDPALAFGNSPPSAGVMSVARVNLVPRMAFTISPISLVLKAGGSGLKNSFVAVYTV